MAYTHRGKPYKLTEEQIKIMWSDQNKCCAICHTEFSLTNNHIDHDHKTKQIRGLLCKPCNQGLGMFKDNPEYLLKAIEYLVGADNDLYIKAQQLRQSRKTSRFRITRFYGKPCVSCENTWRYVTSGECVNCHNTRECMRRNRKKSSDETEKLSCKS